MRRIILSAILLLSTQVAEAEYLYKITIVRAAPGKLLDLIDLFEKRMPVYDAGGDERPLWMRHAQGDQWDLFLMFPMESFSKYYAPERVERRKKAATEAGLAQDEFNRLYYEYSAYHEDLIVEGPPLEDIRKAYDDAGYFHTEMFVALPSKREELYKEREMENVYQKAIGRPGNFTLIGVQGAAWDMISLGFYRDLQHFAGSRDVPMERQETAAKAAGFKGAVYIGPYMRTLILYHRDTHGGTLH
jgi:hypothetical protein